MDWFVAQCKPNSCFKAKKNLDRQGVATFLPLIETTRRKPKEFLTELKPLFPGYLFLSFDAEKIKITTINSTIGLQRLLVLNNIPQTIPRNFVKALKLRCDKNGKLLTGEELKIGSNVEVLKGPFAKMVGMVEKIDSHKRITLLFEILGQKAKMTIPNKELRVLT